VLTKLHLKRNATDRFALCGIRPDHSFVLMAAMSRQTAGAVCQTCMRAATADLEQRNAGHTEKSKAAHPK
jgi:hypothetical protein